MLPAILPLLIALEYPVVETGAVLLPGVTNPNHISFRTCQPPSADKNVSWALRLGGVGGRAFSMAVVREAKRDADPIYATLPEARLLLTDSTDTIALPLSCNPSKPMAWRLERPLGRSNWLLRWGETGLDHSFELPQGWNVSALETRLDSHAVNAPLLTQFIVRGEGVGIQGRGEGVRGEVSAIREGASTIRGQAAPPFEASTCEPEQDGCLVSGNEEKGLEKRKRWQLLDRNCDDRLAEPGGDYLLESIPLADGGMELLYLGGARLYPGLWKPGELKARLRPTGIENVWNVEWIDAEKTPLTLEIKAHLDQPTDVLTIHFPRRSAALRFRRLD